MKQLEPISVHTIEICPYVSGTRYDPPTELKAELVKATAVKVSWTPPDNTTNTLV